MSKVLKRFTTEGLIPFLNSKRDEVLFHSGNAHMFQQDISQHKMPYSDRLERYPEFKVTIDGNDRTSAIEILMGLSKYRHNYSDTKLLCDVINSLSSSIYYFGKVFVCRRTKVDGTVEFGEIFPHNVFKFGKRYFQFIPKADRDDSSIYFRIETSKNIYPISIFKNSFSRFKFRLIEKSLLFTDGVFPKFYQDNQFQNKTFDVSYYKQLEIRFMSLITKEYAWKLRFLADEHSNEYFKIYSSYKSAIRDAQDRELLIEQLNKMLRHFNINASITLTGIPTSSDLKKSLLQLKSGKKSFRQALDDAYLR